MAVKHMDMAYEYKGQRGIIEMRKQLAWYMKGIKDAAAIRNRINTMDNREEIRSLLIEYRNELMNE
jgi:tRNA-dihydrouridine synthase